MKRIILFVLVQALFVQGCATMQHMVPGRPLKKNEAEARISFGISTNNFNSLSLQIGAFFGITDRDAFGFAFNNFMIISPSLSYVRYWNTGEYYWNYQFHINDLWGIDYNPYYETDLAVSKIDDNIVHSVKLGLGLYTTPLIPFLAGWRNEKTAHNEKTAFVPVISYQFQNPTIHLEAEAIPGMAKYFVQRYKSQAYLYSDADSLNRSGNYRNMKRIYSHDEIKEIKQTGNDYKTATWVISLTDGDTLILANRDPWADCYTCDQRKKEFEAYKASEDDRVLWVYYDNNRWFRKGMFPTLIEVNMKKVIEDFNKGKDLVLISEKDLLENSIKAITPVASDLFFSIGHSKR